MTTVRKALIVTSISSPNAVLKALAQGAQENNFEFIVIGDTKSPKDFQLEGCRFVSIEEQDQLKFSLTKILPKKHYARKNLGYLLAKDNDFIVETDDDNFPYASFWEERTRNKNVNSFLHAGWMNVYQFFSSENIWPRGFPIQHLQNKITPNSSNETILFQSTSHREWFID